MIRSRLHYHRPTSPEEASGLLADHHGDVRVLGGGTWLLPLMSRGEIAVSHIVDLRGLGLNRITRAPDGVEVGAMVSYEQVLADDALAASVPLLAKMARGVTGGRQLRNLATLVGSACYANPASEVPGLLVALDARLRVHGPSGEREVSAAEFYVGAFETALGRGEFVRAFGVAPTRGRGGYVKVKLSAASTPVATAAALLDEETGETSVTLGAVEARPRRIDLSAARGGDGYPAGEVEALVESNVTDAWADVLADADYRRAIAPVVARRAVEQLQEA